MNDVKHKLLNWSIKQCTKKNIMTLNVDDILITSKFEELIYKFNIKFRNDNFIIKYKTKLYYNNKYISNEFSDDGIIFSINNNISFENDIFLENTLNQEYFKNNYEIHTFNKIICYKNVKCDINYKNFNEEKITNIFRNIQNNFIIIIPSYNNDIEITKKCINSVINQNYKNYKVCFIDDNSNNSDNLQNIELTKNICELNNFKFIKNDINHGALYNIVNGIKLLSPKDDDIIITLDGDDWLENEFVLDILNANYQDNTQLTYGRFLYSNKNNKNADAMGFSEEINEQYLKVGFRKMGWIFSHLRTFKYRLWKNIKDSDLRDENNNYYMVTWDMAFMFPMIEMAYPYVNLIDIPLYVYNVDNELNDSKLRESEQIKCEQIIRLKKPYESLYDYSIYNLKKNEYYLKELELNDYHCGYMDIINKLTNIGNEITFQKFSTYFNIYKKENSKIYVLKSINENKIIGTGKILIEQKLHNNFSNMGHIEDVVVDENYRKLGIGKYIIEKLTKYGFENNCYKIVLCCNDFNEQFYKNCDYKKKGIEFVKYK